MTETRIQVGGERPYEVIVGTGVLGALPDLVPKSARTAAVIHPEGLGAVARPVGRVLAEAATEKFGGDSVEELRRNAEGYLKSLVIS